MTQKAGARWAVLAAFILLSSGISWAEEAAIKRFANLTLEASCPGDLITANLTASDGLPAHDVELRLVLYSPYMGLRALQHTGADGLAGFDLDRSGTYRVYISTDAYEHPKYVEFDYPELCPPPPPKYMDIGIEADCDEMRLLVEAVSEGTPLEGVLVTADGWSSVTGSSGTVYLPFEEGEIPVTATKTGFASVGFYCNASCAPPPECLDDAGCGGFEFCAAGVCQNVTGECGYADNHAWVAYGCCADADCGNESLECKNNTCMAKQLPPEPPANENATPPSGDAHNGSLPSPGNGGKDVAREAQSDSFQLVLAIIAAAVALLVIFLALGRKDMHKK